METIIDITAALSIAFALYLITSKFMSPSRILRFGCFISLFIIELLFILLIPKTPGITEIAHAICCVSIAFSLYVNLKSFLRSLDIALSILILYVIFLYVICTPVAIVLSLFFKFGDDTMKFIIYICNASIGILLIRYKDKLFNPSDNTKILQFHLLLKILIFSIINFVVPISLKELTLLNIVIMGFFTAITAVGFFLLKCYSKLNTKLENENRESAIALTALRVESEYVGKQYDEIIKIRHYYTSLIRSQLKFIDANDLPGLKNYYNERIAPINDQLKKQIESYKQIEHIHVPILKARIIELINTVSQRSNTKFILFMNTEVDSVNMEDIDLFTITNIFIDNALEETKTHETPVIEIIMTQNHESFIFQIKNSIFGLKSEPKPDNPHRGLKIIDEILVNYVNVIRRTYVEYGWFIQELDVFNNGYEFNGEYEVINDGSIVM